MTFNSADSMPCPQLGVKILGAAASPQSVLLLVAPSPQSCAQWPQEGHPSQRYQREQPRLQRPG